MTEARRSGPGRARPLAQVAYRSGPGRARPLAQVAHRSGPGRARPLARVAIVGTGMWAPKLAAAAQRAGLEIVTCHSRSEEKRTAFAERFGCAAAASLEEAIGHPEVEGVVLATPNDTHEEQTLACVAQGRHVFVEKPIAGSTEAGERMRRACAEAGVTLMVGHAFRRLGAARRAKQLLDAGALGRVVLAEANMSLPGTFKPEAWRAERERNPGGPIMQLGIHHVDTLAYWLGPVRRASGRFAHVHSHAEIDDVGVVTLEFESGVLAGLTGSYVSPKTLSLRLLGTEAVLDYRTDFSVWPDARALDGVTTLELSGERIEFEERDMLAEELAEFGRCIRGEAEPETGANEGIAALAAVLQALEAHREAVA
jgi:predicted dehydrogenase